MDICKTLNNNKYDINFMNTGVNDVLDDVVESFEKLEKRKKTYVNFLMNMLILVREKVKKTKI